MSEKTDDLENIPDDQPLKLNVNGAGYYRVQYDPRSWDSLLTSVEQLSVEDRVNLACDAWALVEADRAPLSLYFGLIEKLPGRTELAEREQIINVVDFVDRLLIGHPDREKFQRYARSILRPSFEVLGWEPKTGETVKAANLRVGLIEILGDLNDPGIIAGCRDRFQKYLSDPTSLAPDLRPACLGVVARYADEPTWNKLHELGLKTTSIEEKQNYYDALARVTESKLIAKSLQLALTEELPSSRAIFLVGKVARYSDHPEIAWQFAKANMKALLAKTDALQSISYAPSLFTFFSDTSRAEELKAYAKANLPPTSSKEVAKAVDEIEFRSAFKARLIPQLNAWIENRKSGQ
jgi:ERAP1-like C-terminal domain